MSRTLLAVAAGIVSATFVSAASANNASRAASVQDHAGHRYANTGLAGRGTVAVPLAKDRAEPYALTGRRVAEKREYRTISVGSRVVAVVPGENDGR